MKLGYLFCFALLLLIGGAPLFAAPTGGARAFSNPIYFNVTPYAKKLLTADFDGDGCSDMAVLSWEIDHHGKVTRLDTGEEKDYGRIGLLSIFHVENCDKAKSGAELPIFSSIPTYLEFGDDPACTECAFDNDFVIADMDKDGKPDLVALNAASHTVSIFRNDGTGHFSAPVVLDLQDPVLPNCFYLMHSSPRRPALVSAGNFSANGNMDIAVEYIDQCQYPDSYSQIIAVYRNALNGRKPLNLDKDTYKVNYDFAPSGPSIAEYNYNSPFYYKFRPFQILSASLLSKDRDQLLAPVLNTVSLQAPVFDFAGKDIFAGDSAYTIPLAAYSPVAVGDVDGNSLLDVISDGGARIFLVNSKGSASFATASTADGYTEDSKALVTADFDNDGLLDIASAQHLNELWIGYGDPAKTMAGASPLSPLPGPADSSFRRDYRFAPPWAANTYSMVVGNFNGDVSKSDPTKPWQDIAVLGSDVVTVFLNAGRSAQLDPIVINQVTGMGKAGDVVQALGQFHPGTISQVAGFTFTGIPGSDTGAITYTVLPYSFRSLTAGSPDQLTFLLPDVDSLPPGRYTVSAYNAQQVSMNLPALTMTVTGPVPFKPTIESVSPAQPIFGHTFEIIGTAFGKDTPNQVNLIHLINPVTGREVLRFNPAPAGKSPAAGEFTALAPSGGKGYILIDLPSEGGALISGDYFLTLDNMTGSSSNFRVTIRN